MKSQRHVIWAASLALAALTVLPSYTRAEDPAPPAPKTEPPPAVEKDKAKRKPSPEAVDAARNRRDAAMAELGLTDDQRDKLRAAQKEQAEKVRAVREDTSLTREQKTAKMRELRDSLAATTKTILTPDQYAKWQKARETRRPRPDQGGPGAGGAAGSGGGVAPAPAPAPAAKP